MNYFITGIGTDIGKTIVAAVLTEALHADYWKPVQCGDLENSDSITIKKLVSNPVSVIHPEKYKLTQPLSPHAASKFDGTIIHPEDILLPATKNHLLIEGAGGLMVPLTDDYLIIDLIHKFLIPVILVSKNYLGSINHTLLSAELLAKRNIPVAGIIFNGDENMESENVIQKISKLPVLGRIANEDNWSRETVLKYATQFSYLGK